MDKPQAQGPPPGPATTPDYVSLREIGVGSYGRVWLVQDRTSGEYCAVKIIYRHLFEDDVPYKKERAGVQRFSDLSTASRSLLKIIHVGLHDEEGYFYYLMELADARQAGQGISPANYAPRTLKWELEKTGHRERLPAEDCLRIMLSLTAGLEELHAGGLIHRDIKPANIIFVKGEPKLADIGLVTSKDLTRTIVSTPGYFREGEPQSERSDIYGLGKVLYEMLTGLDRRDDVDFPRLPEGIRGWLDRELALELNDVVSKSCARSPRKRYQSAREMKADLELLKLGKSLKGRKRREQLAYAAGAALALAAAVGLTIGTLRHRSGTTQVGETTPISLIKLPMWNSRRPMPVLRDLALARAALRQASGDLSSTNTPPSTLPFAPSATTTNEASQTPRLLAQLELDRDEAAAKGDFTTALSACDRMGDAFAFTPFQINAMEATTLRQSQLAVGASATQTALSERSLLLALRAMAMDDYGSAEEFAKTAAACATITGDSFLESQAAFVKTDLARGKEYYLRIERWAQTLRDSPDDPRSNLECGKYLCFVKNAWAAGLPMIAKGASKRFRLLAEQEFQHPSKPEDRVALGHSWWSLGQSLGSSERTNCLRRARYWYLKGTAVESDASRKEDLRRKLQERLTQVPAEVAQLRVVINVEGGADLHISSDEISLQNSYDVRNVKINCYLWGTFPKGGPEILKNCGPTRFLPEAIDFSKAQIAKRRISRQWGKINKFQPSEDHLEISLGDAPAGSSTFELLITFPR